MSEENKNENLKTKSKSQTPVQKVKMLIFLLLKILLFYILICVIWQIIAYFFYFIQTEINYKIEKSKIEKEFKNNPQLKNIDVLQEYKVFPAIIKVSENKILRIGGNPTKPIQKDKDNLYSPYQSNTAEIYNPFERTSKKINNMKYQRGSSLKSILLDNGNVLIVGGNGYVPLKKHDFVREIEIFNPQKETFTVVDKLSYDIERDKLCITKLKNGNVLIIGNNEYSIFSSKTNKIIKTQKTNFETWKNNTAVLLNNGKVILTGRFFISDNKGEKIMKSCILYNPISDTFEIGPDMPFIRTSPKPVKLDNGNVIYIGGNKELNYKNEGNPLIVQLYDYKKNKFSSIGKLLENRIDSKPILLPNNKIYIIGTNSITDTKLIPKPFFILKSETLYPRLTCEIYDINSNTSQKTNICPILKTKYYQPILLNKEKLLVFSELDLLNTKNKGDLYKSEVEILNIGDIK